MRGEEKGGRVAEKMGRANDRNRGRPRCESHFYLLSGKLLITEETSVTLIFSFQL